MNRTLSGFIGALLPFSVAAQTAPSAAARQPVRFVEFYTSEACAACLPADAAFAQLAAKKHVIALGFHVGYWDYLGWKDRFALHVAARRQWDYARRWHSGEVFTPEMIVNGMINGIGNNPADIAAMLHQAGPLPRIGLALKKGQLVVRVPALPHPAGAVLWIATFDLSRSVAVGHGENAGRLIQEVNIVRSAAPVTMLMTVPATIPVPVADLEAHADVKSYGGIASFIQEPGCGPIIAAGRLLLNHPSR